MAEHSLASEKAQHSVELAFVDVERVCNIGDMPLFVGQKVGNSEPGGSAERLVDNEPVGHPKQLQGACRGGVCRAHDCWPASLSLGARADVPASRKAPTVDDIEAIRPEPCDQGPRYQRCGKKSG